MPRADGSNWMLVYQDPKNSTRLLISLPPDMLRDAHLLAKARGQSLSEFVRCAITGEVASAIAARPEISPSFRGVRKAS